VRATAFLLLIACRPEPAAVLEPEPLPAATATLGTAIVIEELGEGFVQRTNVDAGGRIDALPLCGPTPVEGATASQICDRLAACMAAVLREPLVRIAFDESRASCRAEGEPVPEDDELLDAVAARLPHTRADDVLVAELVDLVIDRHTALLRRTDAHPSVHAQAERAQRLLASMGDEGPPTAIAAPHVLRRLAEARDEESELAKHYGPKHPSMQLVQRRLAALQRLDTAIVRRDDTRPDAIAFVRAHEAALLDDASAPSGAPPCPGLDDAFAQRIAYWQGRRDASRDPSRAETILDGLMQARMAARSKCASTTRSPRP
jgi:hypothetical protein